MKNLKNLIGAGLIGFGSFGIFGNEGYGQANIDGSNKALFEIVKKFSNAKTISGKIEVSEYRDFFNKPLSFIITYNLSDSSKLLFYYSDICKSNKIRKMSLIDSKGKTEDLTSYILDKKALNKWFKDTQKGFRKCPPGAYYTRKI